MIQNFYLYRVRKNIVPIFLIILSLNGAVNAQEGAIDSLLNLLKITKNDSIKVDLYNEISYSFKNNNLNKAVEYANKGLRLSEKMNYDHGKMRSYGQLGNAYSQTKDNSNALSAYLNAEFYAKKTKNEAAEGVVLHNIGVLYSNIQQYAKAEEYYLRALEYDKKTRSLFDMGETCNSLGSALLQQKKFDLAKKYLNESINNYIKSGARGFSGRPYSNLGLIFRAEKNSLAAIRNFENAFDNFTILNETKECAHALRLIAIEYDKLKKPDKVLFYYEKAEKLAPLDPSGEIEGSSLLNRVTQAYALRKDFKNAYNALKVGYDYYVKNYELKDSIKNIERDAIFADMATKYETDKKEKLNRIQKLEIANEKASNSRKKTIIYAFILGMIMLAVLLFIAVRSYRLAKLASRKIQKQKEQIEGQRDEIAYKNKEITSSIEYAKSLQDAILPNEEFIKSFIPKNFILWLPRDIVSGDFYWFYEKAGKIFLAAADCTGHGVPGAFVSMTCHNILNQVVIDQDTEHPGEILSKVHIAVSKVFRREGSLSKANDGMDIALMCIDRQKNSIEFAGAMNPLVRIHQGEVISYKTDRYAIGGRTPIDFTFTTQKIEFFKGDIYYMFSDGFKDQFGGEEGKKYMNTRFVKLLHEIHKDDFENQKSKLKSELLTWIGHKHERTDDVLIIGFEI